MAEYSGHDCMAISLGQLSLDANPLSVQTYERHSNAPPQLEPLPAVQP